MAKLTKTYTVTMKRTRTFEQVAHVEIEARHAAEAWEIAEEKTGPNYLWPAMEFDNTDRLNTGWLRGDEVADELEICDVEANR